MPHLVRVAEDGRIIEGGQPIAKTGSGGGAEGDDDGVGIERIVVLEGETYIISTNGSNVGSVNTPSPVPPSSNPRVGMIARGSSRSSSKSSKSLDHSRYHTAPVSDYPVKPFVFFMAMTVALSGLVFGYDIGGSGGTFEMEGFRKAFRWPDLESRPDPAWVADAQGWITALFALGCVVGSIPSGSLADYIGRRWSIILLATIFSVGAVIQMFPGSMNGLYAGRFISGLGVGGLSMAATLYQSETAPSQVRGLVVSLQQLSITLGILLASGLNVGLQHWDNGWRVSYGGKVIFSLLLILAMLFVLPESPRWLLDHGKEDEAKAALALIRQEEEVDIMMQLIKDNIEADRQMGTGKWGDLLKPFERMRYRTMLAFIVQLMQQFTGINAVMYFAPSIFSSFLSSELAILANLGISAVNVISTFIALYAVDRAGRRSLLILGGLGMSLFTGLFALFTSSMFDYKNNHTIGTVIILCTALYVMNFAYSWGPLAWVVPAEVFPQRLRGKGMTITTFANWLTNFVIAKYVPIMIQPQSLNLWGTFLFFASFCLFMAIFVAITLPETKGVPLEDMAGLFDFWILHTSWRDRLSLSGGTTNNMIRRASSQKWERAASMSFSRLHHLGGGDSLGSTSIGKETSTSAGKEMSAGVEGDHESKFEALGIISF